MRLHELKQLNEASNQSFFKTFDATKLSTADVAALLAASGYHDNDFEDTVYGGYNEKTHSHIYYGLFFDDNANDEENGWAIADLYVALNKKGKLECEFGTNVKSDMADDQATNELEKLKAK